MARKRFITPPTLPEEAQCRGLIIPASKEWLGVFSEALSATFYSHNYEQVNATDLTPDEVAARCYDIYLSWLDSACDGGECPPIELPDGSKIYRKNPTTRRWEFVNEAGEWEEPIGDDAIPAPAAREELTEDDALCAAATNAVYAIYHLWLTMLDQWEDEIAPDLAWAALAVETGLLLGGQYYKPLAAAGALVGVAFDAAFALFDIMTENTWDAEFLQRLICIFIEHATIDMDGVVTFDASAINAAINMSFWFNGEDLMRVMQTTFLIGAIGEQALNTAGGLTTHTGECAGCNEWSQEFSMDNGLLTGGLLTIFEGSAKTDGSIGWVNYATPFDGAYRRLGVSVDIDTTQTTIKAIELRAYAPAGSTNKYWYLTTTNSTGLSFSPYISWNWDPGAYYAWNTGFDTADETTGSSSTITVRLTSNSSNDWRMRGIRISGTGRNPWAG